MGEYGAYIIAAFMATFVLMGGLFLYSVLGVMRVNRQYGMLKQDKQDEHEGKI